VRVDNSGVVTGREGWPDDDGGLLIAVTAFYRNALAGSLEAQGWLERHRLADGEGLEMFGVGFADRTVGLSLPARVRGRDDDARGRLARLGVLRSRPNATPSPSRSPSCANASLGSPTAPPGPSLTHPPRRRSGRCRVPNAASSNANNPAVNPDSVSSPAAASTRNHTPDHTPGDTLVGTIGTCRRRRHLVCKASQ
jgi:hypothetical protein